MINTSPGATEEDVYLKLADWSFEHSCQYHWVITGPLGWKKTAENKIVTENYYLYPLGSSAEYRNVAAVD